jgi:polynucleotide 5'-kinase involved in rRNA processing
LEKNDFWQLLGHLFIFRRFLSFSVQPILVAAGGKGVGKSTMLKYIANKLIDQVGPVLWIDLDPGQAEFTLPGICNSQNATLYYSIQFFLFHKQFLQSFAKSL